jgi:hypothetical protein
LVSVEGVVEEVVVAAVLVLGQVVVVLEVAVVGVKGRR